MPGKSSFNIWRACNKIRAAIFRIGIDLKKYFKDFDPNKDGLISEARFTSVLNGPLKLSIGLSDQEISEITDYFRVQDGRIMYSNFCEVIHGEVPNFSQNDPLSTGMEWNDPYHVNQISQYEEKRVHILLAKISSSLKTKCILLRPYFQDYELIAKGNGTVTIGHFARVLNFLGIMLSAEDFNLLLKKFLKDSYTVNYIAFIAALSDIYEYMDEYDLHGLSMNQNQEYFIDFRDRGLMYQLPTLRAQAQILVIYFSLVILFLLGCYVEGTSSAVHHLSDETLETKDS